MTEKKTGRPPSYSATQLDIWRNGGCGPDAVRAHQTGDGGAVAGGAERFSPKCKLAAAQRLIRGESLEAVFGI